MEQGDKGIHLPGWVREWAMKLLPWALMGIVAGGITLWTDNIGNKRDISRNTDWNAAQDARDDKSDLRDDRMEARIDRMEGTMAERQQTDQEFQQEMRDKIDRLLKISKR